MAVTEGMRTDTDGPAGDGGEPPRGKREPLLGRGTWPDAVAALTAVLTLIGGIWGWQWLTGAKGGPRGGVAANTAAPAPNTTTVAPSTPGATPPGPSTADTVHLDSMTPIAGRTAPLPAALDRAKYPHAVVIDCPSNQTGETETVVRYQLFRRYRQLSADVTGWSDSRQPFRVQVQVVTNSVQRDGTPVHLPVGKQAPTVNSAPVRLTAAVTAAGEPGRSGIGADELELHVGCDQPHDAVILSDARLET